MCFLSFLVFYSFIIIILCLPFVANKRIHSRPKGVGASVVSYVLRMDVLVGVHEYKRRWADNESSQQQRGVFVCVAQQQRPPATGNTASDGHTSSEVRFQWAATSRTCQRPAADQSAEWDREDDVTCQSTDADRSALH